MIGSDELFKQISFRASAMGRLASDAYETALEQGIKPKDINSAYIADYVGTQFHGLIRSSGSRYSNKVSKRKPSWHTKRQQRLHRKTCSLLI